MKNNLIKIILLFYLSFSAFAQENKILNVVDYYNSLPPDYKADERYSQEALDSVIDIENGYISYSWDNDYGKCNYAFTIFRKDQNNIICGITYNYQLMDCRNYSTYFLEYKNDDWIDISITYDYRTQEIYNIIIPELSIDLFFDNSKYLQLVKDYNEYYAASKSLFYDYIFELLRYGTTIKVGIAICELDFDENISTYEEFNKISDEAKTLMFKWNKIKGMFELLEQ